MISSLHPFLSHFCLTSEGVLAYYWSQFDIPVEDLEIVPEFSEERVLGALETGIKAQRSTSDSKRIQIVEVTGSCRDHRGQVWVTPRGKKIVVCYSRLQIMTFNNQQR